MAKKFIVRVDTQVDFMLPNGRLYVPGAEKLIAPMLQYLTELDPDEVIGVMATFDTHHEDTYPQTEESKQFPIHCVEGSIGWENVIPNRVDTHELYKGCFDMWEDTDPQRHVWTTARDTDGVYCRRDDIISRLSLLDPIVVIMGVAADYCVKYAIQGFLDHGFRVEVPRHLTVGIHRQIDQVWEEDFFGRQLSIV